MNLLLHLELIIFIFYISNYVSFLNYYEKYWLKYNQLNNISEISNYSLSFQKTNNPCEIFNKHLNAKIIKKSPRISYLVQNIFDLILNHYKECWTSLILTPKKKIKNQYFLIEVNKVILKINDFNNNGNFFELMNGLGEFDN